MTRGTHVVLLLPACHVRGLLAYTAKTKFTGGYLKMSSEGHELAIFWAIVRFMGENVLRFSFFFSLFFFQFNSHYFHSKTASYLPLIYRVTMPRRLLMEYPKNIYYGCFDTSVLPGYSRDSQRSVIGLVINLKFGWCKNQVKLHLNYLGCCLLTRPGV